MIVLVCGFAAVTDCRLFCGNPMAKYEHLDEFQAQLRAKRWFAKAILTFATLGGIYGGVMGAAIGAVSGAAGIIEVAAAVFALLCAAPGSRYGFFFGIVNRIRFGSLFVGVIAAIGGAILGGFLATMFLLAMGAILGGVAGWFLVQAGLAVQHGTLRRLWHSFIGGVLGMFVGALLWAVNLNQTAALAGAAWGLGIGTIVGPLLLLLFFGTLSVLPRSHGGRTNYVDASFQGEDQDERLAP
jgi:hypothetical protein